MTLIHVYIVVLCLANLIQSFFIYRLFKQMNEMELDSPFVEDKVL